MSQYVDIEALNQQIYIESQFVEKLNVETHKVIVGQNHMIERLMIGLLTRGHILLEGLFCYMGFIFYKIWRMEF